MKVSFIIPNYNGESSIKENIPRLIESIVEKNYEVIIVDDYSTDSSLEQIELLIQRFKDINIILIKHDRNKGFSSAVNTGVKNASGDVLILLNTDVYPQVDIVEKIKDKFKNDQVFAVGFLDKSIEDGKPVLRGRGIGKWMRGFLIHSKGDIEKKDTLWASGGSSAFNKKIWDKLGGLNEIYNPFYWEDLDISYRARKSGYKVLFDPSITVVHEHEKGSIKKKFTPSQIKRIAFRNQFIFVWINSSFRTLLSHFLWLPYHILNAVLRGDINFLIGFYNSVIHIPRIFAARNRVQKLFTLADSEAVLHT